MVNLTLEQAQLLLAYLQTRPCGEVLAGVLWLTQAIEEASIQKSQE